MTAQPGGSDLSVRNESIQSLYTRYRAGRFNVNRRYQRKLVWSVEEKQRLIDSILLNMPIPLFLVAEKGMGSDATFEVIDGMQRLNAMFSYLENEFQVNGNYFDLDALADTKSQKDSKELSQRHPISPRDTSVAFSNYTVALSVFRSHDGAGVDEVFRRINSGGKTLSFQELRQAGTVSFLADLVRIISSRIRGDASPSDIVPLGEMPLLSITNRDLPYGVKVDEIFWVRHGILRGDDVRISDDEQLVLDILTDCLVRPLLTGSKETRDKAYDFVTSEAKDLGEKSLGRQINSAIESVGQEELEQRFMHVYDVLRGMIDHDGQRFATTIGIRRGGRAPRYFHVLFIAVFELMFQDDMRLKDREGAASRLMNVSNTAMRIPPGSDWSGEAKRGSIDAVKGLLRPYFEQSGDANDLAIFGGASRVERLLGNAVVEQQLFDVKQGFYRLDASRQFDEAAFDKVCETLSAMANSGVKTVGYIVLGVSDRPEHTERIRQLDGVRPARYRTFDIVGLDREADLRNSRMGEYWDWLNRKIRSHAKLDRRIASQVSQAATVVDYAGHTLVILKVEALNEPNFFADELFERNGSDNRKLSRQDYLRVYNRFTQ